jgi:hypothetical protein
VIDRTHERIFKRIRSMSTRYRRREFLSISATATGLGGLMAVAPLRAHFAAPAHSDLIPVDPDILPLVRLIEETPPERVVPVFVDQIRKGLDAKRLFTASFLHVIRQHDSGHHVYMAHAVQSMCTMNDRSQHFLPLFWQLGTMKFEELKFRPQSPPPKTIKDDKLPSLRTAPQLVDEGIRKKDEETACRALLSISRGINPRQAFERLWKWGAALCGGGNIGHTAIAVSNAHRTLEAIGWVHAEPVLRFLAEDLSNGDGASSANLTRENEVRSQTATLLDTEWSTEASNRESVLDLLDVFRSGQAADACQVVHQQLLAGKIRAGAVWDALHLVTSELSIAFHLGGASGLARHSVTMANALHHAYRTCTEPSVRLFSLLEAVEWACTFLSITRRQRELTDLKITEITQRESPDAARDALDDIFSSLPPRRSHHWFRDRSGQLKGLQCTYAYAQKHADHQPFMKMARDLVCLKSTEDAHDFKFPIAAFENYSNVSPEWRPHILAASVYCLHGTQMEDNPTVQEARLALSRL